MTKSILLADGVTTSVISSFVENFSPPSSSQKLPEENKKDQDKPKRRPCVVGLKQRAHAQKRSVGWGSPPSPNISDSLRPSYRFTLIEANAQDDAYQRLLGDYPRECPDCRLNHTLTVGRSQMDGTSSTTFTIDHTKEPGAGMVDPDDSGKGSETVNLYHPYKQRVW